MELTYCYAQVDADGRCFAVTCPAAELPESPSLIRLSTYDDSYVGRTFVNGVWT